MKYDWKDAENDNFYYYNTEDGRVVGQVHNVIHTKIWIAKIVFNHNEELYLGQFIHSRFAMAAVERHWNVQSRTLLEGDF
jgi:hypothetical protein